MDAAVDLHSNVHIGLDPPCQGDYCLIADDSYHYYHYRADGFDDRGWGCGYRTLQTICSWINMSTERGKQKGRHVPSLKEIQTILVEIEDKEIDFIDSTSWIGSFEICLVLDNLYGIPSRIVHINPGGLNRPAMDFLKTHFIDFKSPVMMGGDADSASKCLLGIFYPDEIDDVFVLVLDPHFAGSNATPQRLQEEHWVSWKRLSEFNQFSFYNFCLPQIKADALERSSSE